MADYDNGLPPTTDGSEGKISGIAINKSEYIDFKEPEIRSISIQKAQVEEDENKKDPKIEHISIQKAKIEFAENMDFIIQSISIEKKDVGMNMGIFM